MPAGGREGCSVATAAGVEGLGAGAAALSASGLRGGGSDHVEAGPAAWAAPMSEQRARAMKLLRMPVGMGTLLKRRERRYGCRSLYNVGSIQPIGR